MKNTLLTIFTLAISLNASAHDCPKEWKSSSLKTHCEWIEFKTRIKYPITSIFGSSPDEAEVKALIRTGYLEENKNVAFKGNVLYFEGLADSMLNHKPLFDKLTKNGFRVIAFDYMGQGGSKGSMNDTRLQDIPKLGKMVYQKYARDDKSYKSPMIIGWSTGGLAAYLTAIENESKKIVMIAPGIIPNVIVGEHNFKELDFDIITLKSLTGKSYAENEYNPHVEGIRPRSPLDVNDFATDLIKTSFSARFKKAHPDVSGLVLLSGKKDSFVNAKKTASRLRKIAPHFSQITYQEARHEIDNEVPSIQEDSHQQIIRFLLEK